MPRSIRSFRVAVFGALIASSFGLTASLGAQTKAAPPASAGVCSLMTKEEAAAALAVAVTGPTEKTVADGYGPGSTVSHCGYEGSGLQSISLNVARLPATSAPMFKSMCAKKANDGLGGLGDLACWYNDQHQELHAFKGTTFVSVQLRRSGDTTEAIKGVMKKALERLR